MEKIELRKVRDFGALFNDSIAFLRLNFKSLFGIILFLAGPFIIMTGLFSGYMQSLQSKIVASSLFPNYFGSNGGLLAADFFGTFGIFFLIYLLTTLVNTACICLFFKNYNNSTPEELPLTKDSVSPFLVGATWRLFYNVLLVTLIMFVLGLAIVGICAVLFMIPVLNILFGIALIIGCLIILPILVYIANVSNYIIIRDEVLITTAIGKAFRYMRGNFWWTWLLMVAVGISLLIGLTLFNLPISILNATRTFVRSADGVSYSSHNSILYIIFGAVALVGQLLFISPIFSTFCIFNFHSQEEKNEGTGLMSRIDELDIK